MKALIWGIPMERANGMPYVTIDVNAPIAVGKLIIADSIPYLVVKSDEITGPNQAQNVYVEEQTPDVPKS